MKITLHDGRTISEPTDADVDALFAGLADAGDFIILNDEDRGEVRAAGPQNGSFLLQCDLPKDGRIFAGARPEVGFAEAIGIFREFRAGRAQWSSEFVPRETPPARVAKFILILAVVAAVTFALWWFRPEA